jgi:hypothetical protein
LEVLSGALKGAENAYFSLSQAVSRCFSLLLQAKIKILDAYKVDPLP